MIRLRQQLRVACLAALICFGVVTGLLVTQGVIDPGQWQEKPPPINIYGTWREVEVAPFAREAFTLSEQGVTVEGSLVSTTFAWNGEILSYSIGDKLYVYDYRGGNMIRRQPAHYVSAFSRTP